MRNANVNLLQMKFWKHVGAVGAIALSVSCGVKGKPLPPLEPAAIGRGSPTYKGAAEQAKPSMVPGLPDPTPTPRRSGK